MKKPFERVLLHIGPPKTGTTSIQHFLTSNQAALQARGFYVPSATRRGPNHINLPLLFGPRRESLIRLTGSVEARRETIENALAAEITKIGGGHALLISSEHLFAADPSAVDTYRQFFAPYAERFESLMYLRRQDRWMVSRVLQSRKTGARGDIRLRPHFPDVFEETVRLWDAGSDRCDIRRFDAEFLFGGSLLADFCQAIGCDSTGLGTELLRNPAVLQEQLELVDALNTALAMPFAKQITYRSRFLDLCTEILGGTRFEFPREAALATFAAYSSINSWLRETRDPEGPAQFFNTDFSDYPIEAFNSRAYTDEQLTELAAVVDGRLCEHDLDVSRTPHSAARASLIEQIVTGFISLHAHELEQARAARQREAIAERLRAREAGRRASGDGGGSVRPE